MSGLHAKIGLDRPHSTGQRDVRVLTAVDTGDYFAFDVMSEVIFGMRYNALKESTYRFVARALEASNIRISALVQSSLLGAGRLDRYLFPDSIRGRNKFLGFIGSLLRDRSKASLAENGNVFTFLETASDPDGGKELSTSEIRAECATLVVAGTWCSVAEPRNLGARATC